MESSPEIDFTTKLEKLADLLDKHEFGPAETELVKARRQDPLNPWINYCLGVLYSDSSNPKRSVGRARHYFGYAVESPKPVEDAFRQLALLEHADAQAIRVLRAGLERFPRSVPLYKTMLSRSPYAARPALYAEIQEKGLEDDEVREIMLSTFASLGKCDRVIALASELRYEERPKQLALDLIRGIAQYELGQHAIAASTLQGVVSLDITYILKSLPHFCLVLALMSLQDRSGAVRAFQEIPLETGLDDPFGPWLGHIYFDHEKYCEKALSAIIRVVRDKKTLAKAKGFRALLAQGSAVRTHRSAVKDLEFANIHLPNNRLFCASLLDTYVEQGECLRAYRMALQYFNSLPYAEKTSFDYEVSTEFIKSAPSEEFSKILKDLETTLGSEEADSVSIAVGVFNPVVQRLHSEAKYSTIAGLADSLGEGIIKHTSVLFEVAYAYGNQKRRRSAVRAYQAYLLQNGDSSAVFNNLAVLYQEEGDLQRAEEYFRKATKLEPEWALSKDNLSRVVELRNAGRQFATEEYEHKRSLLAFWQKRNEEGVVAIELSQLTRLLSLVPDRARTELNYLLEKKYLLKATEYPSEARGKGAYRLNPEITPLMESIERDVLHDSMIARIGEQINPESLRAIGYRDELQSALRKVTSGDLQSTLRRDLLEAAVAYLAGSFKSCLVLCGSIIEAVILDRLLGAGVSKTEVESGKKVSPDRMDLTDLLFVANREHLISEETFHLSHALRGFRNLIHPGVEQRKAAIQVNESNARIAWDVMRKLILEM